MLLLDLLACLSQYIANPLEEASGQFGLAGLHFPLDAMKLSCFQIIILDRFCDRLHADCVRFRYLLDLNFDVLRIAAGQGGSHHPEVG